MKGCYLVSSKMLNDEGFLNKEKEEIFVYIAENELIEISIRGLNFNQPSKADGIVNVTNKACTASNGISAKIDAARICYSNKENRIACYSNIKFLFDAPEFEELFRINVSIDEIYMQCQVAQYCLWNQNQERAKIFTKCLETILDFNTGGKKYHHD